MRRLALVLALAALAAAGPARAGEENPTAAELEAELVCPTCETTLDQSNAPVARRMKEILRARIAAGRTKSEIKAELVAQFGPGVLAVPGTSGFGLVAWALPLAGLLVAGLAVGLLAWRWSRTRGAAPAAGPPLDPETERRVDVELERYDA